MTSRAAVILAGGAGTRLAPLSSDENPKQFLRLFANQSLLQLTWKRLARILPPEAIFVSTNERYRAKCSEHLPEMPAENVLCEPSRRNTAPAIALCTFEVEARFGDAAIAFLPSDHAIGDEPEFLRVLTRAYETAESSDLLVTIGIAPTEPHTGFGYLETGEALAPEALAPEVLAPEVLAPEALRVRRFTEKPQRERAEEFLRAGNYAWNAGIFVWRPSTFRRELSAAGSELVRASRATYDEMPSLSIDYALMEKSEHVATIRGDFGWSDVGSFEALERAGADLPPELRTRRS